MKEEKEESKQEIKLRLATCLRLILKKNKEKSLGNSTIRQLVAESGLSYTILQNASVGKRDPSFTTLITIIKSLGLSFTEFAALYEAVTEEEIAVEVKVIEKNRKKRPS